VTTTADIIYTESAEWQLPSSSTDWILPVTACETTESHTVTRGTGRHRHHQRLIDYRRCHRRHDSDYSSLSHVRSAVSNGQ